LCYVNGHLAIEAGDDTYSKGKVGLAKFRDTAAEFKSFQVGRTVTADGTPQTRNSLQKALDELSPGKPLPASLEGVLSAEPAAGKAILRERARQLEKQAAQLRELALDLHQKRVRTELVKTLKKDDAKVDLVDAALLVAWLDNDELDFSGYRQEFD